MCSAVVSYYIAVAISEKPCNLLQHMVLMVNGTGRPNFVDKVYKTLFITAVCPFCITV